MGTRLLYTMGVNLQKLYAGHSDRHGRGRRSSARRTAGTARTRSGSGATPTLDQYSRDLTEMARQGRLDPVVGREKEIDRLIQILSRRTKNNPCLIGEPGVGKTAIAEGLAQRIVWVWCRTASGTNGLWCWICPAWWPAPNTGESLKSESKRLFARCGENKNILLFIDELHTIIGAGGAEGALDASNILKPVSVPWGNSADRRDDGGGIQKIY